MYWKKLSQADIFNWPVNGGEPEKLRAEIEENAWSIAEQPVVVPVSNVVSGTKS